MKNSFESLPLSEQQATKRNLRSSSKCIQTTQMKRDTKQPICQQLSKRYDNSNGQCAKKTIDNVNIPPDMMIFSNEWNVWIHNNASIDWKISGYEKIMTIRTVKDFWEIMHNFNMLNYMEYQFIIMRNNILPIWEEPENKNGGAASLRIKLSDSDMTHNNSRLLCVWEDMCVYVFAGKMCQTDAINGISFNLKKDMAVIKIWNKNSDIDISKNMPHELLAKYKLRPVYIKNRPEH